MIPLRELQDAASSGTTPTSDLLRRLKVISVRLGISEPVQWVDRELNGYDGTEQLPPYRGPFDLIALGDFFGPFNSRIQNVQIPPSTFPAEMRDGPLFQVRFTQAVAELEHLATRDSVRIAWIPDAVRYYNWAVNQGEIRRVVREDMVLAQVVQPVNPSLLVGILDAVRNRILDLALGWDPLVPADPMTPLPPEERPVLVQEFNTVVYGQGSNVAVASGEVDQSTTIKLPPSGDVDALLKWLRKQGVAPEDISKLQEAIAADEDDPVSRPGPRVQAWLGGLVLKATGAAGSVATGATGGLIAQAIAHHYGLA